MKRIVSFLIALAAVVAVLFCQLPSAKASNESLSGSTVVFGHYEQDNDLTNGAEPIEWMVLDEKDGKGLLISKCALDLQPFNTENANVAWDSCTLRTWLNETFFNEAFNEEEQALIPLTAVNAADAKNPEKNVDPGESTEDHLFLLSINEVNKYFTSDDERLCFPTAYLQAKDTCFMSEEGHCWWWLRSPGDSSHSAALVDFFGFVDCYGYDVYYDFYCVRPAMWLDLTGIGSLDTQTGS